MINETVEGLREAELRPSSRDRIQTVTSSNFIRLVLEGEGPIAVEFMSYGCATAERSSLFWSRWQKW